MRGRLAGRLARACRSRCMKCARCAAPPCTRPTASPNSSAATPSAATRSITPSGSSRRRCDASVRWSCSAAEASRVPAGAALAVDRERFADGDHRRHQRASAHHRRTRGGDVDSRVDRCCPGDRRDRSADQSRRCRPISPRLVGGGHLYFYDAISPIVLAETIDRTKVFRQSRWDRSIRGNPTPAASGVQCAVECGSAGRRSGAAASTTGEGDYLNCPFTRDEYERFYDALTHAESATVHDFDKERFFEGLPAHRGDGPSWRGHAALRADEASGPHRSANGPQPVRRRAAPPGQSRRRITSAWSVSRPS